MRPARRIPIRSAQRKADDRRCRPIPMPTPTLSPGRTTRPRGRLSLLGALAGAALFSCPAGAQDGRAPESQKSKANADRAAEIEASRFCANVAPSIAEARIAWQTKRLSELDAQVKQRLADLEKAEESVQEWVAKRDAMLKTASEDLVAIYARMQPENAAIQIGAMDDQMAAAILGKLKPGVAGAILNEMEAERASRLASFLSGASGSEKKS
jgi:flagellar motility protein MotE (MotC chaperone)